MMKNSLDLAVLRMRMTMSRLVVIRTRNWEEGDREPRTLGFTVTEEFLAIDYLPIRLLAIIFRSVQQTGGF